jgi:hypothetical protein
LGGVGRPPAEPKKRSFFELELKAGLMAPSVRGVDDLISCSVIASNPSGALGGWRRIGEGSGDGPFLSHVLSNPKDVGEDAEGGVRESRESLWEPSMARRGSELFDEEAD